jgi:rhamnogalacturonan endolyase
MKSASSLPIFHIAFLVVALSRSAFAAPIVVPPAMNAPVTVTESASAWTIDNGIVNATIRKRAATMPSLVYHGLEMLGHTGGVWEHTPELARELTDALTIDPATNNGDRAEVSVKGITGGTVMLSPGAPGGGTYCDLEIRYTLARGESGIHTYAIFSHPAAYGAMGVGESRFITFLSRSFDWLTVDSDRNMLACAPHDWGSGVVVHAKEQRIMSQGIYQSSVEHKYSYNAVQYKCPAYGWSSTKDHVGIWFINPSIEYLSGGATKQELMCHFHDDNNPNPIILDYWRGTHYGGTSCSISAGEQWSKVIGPIFIYCNTLSDPLVPSQVDLDALAATAGNPTVPEASKTNATTLWQDALAQAKKQKAAWPYDWVAGIDYPHRDQRATVTGRLILDDPQASTTRLPNLTVGLAHADYPRPRRFGRFQPTDDQEAKTATTESKIQKSESKTDTPQPPPFGRNFSPTIDWAHDAKFYQFWTNGSDDGKFTIANVRPGAYTLHAFADGVLGEFAQADITVAPGQSLDLGRLEWKPVRYGRQIWEIGYPNRTGDKFYKGDGPNYWLWGWCLRYPLLFPDDITYTIGKSDYHRDWFFEQVPHGLSTAWLNADAKDPANQPFGWVKAESLSTYPQSDQIGPWRTYGRGRATTWTIKFNLDETPRGQAALRIALAGADGRGGLAISVNAKSAGTIYPIPTNAIRYNTNKSVWQEQTLKFDATLLHEGENQLQFTVPAGDLCTGVVYDYLRLELDENSSATNWSD